MARRQVSENIPAKPEQADRKNNGADDHRREPLFWDRFPVLGVGFFEVGRRGPGDEAEAHCYANDEGGEGERADSQVPAALFVECNGVLMNVSRGSGTGRNPPERFPGKERMMTDQYVLLRTRDRGCRR